MKDNKAKKAANKLMKKIYKDNLKDKKYTDNAINVLSERVVKSIIRPKKADK